MVKYMSKQNIADQLYRAYMEDNYSVYDSDIPRLAFDNKEAKYPCESCKHDMTKFQHNIAEAAGTDSVIFEWNVDLERLYLTGAICSNCGYAEIYLHEKTPEADGELIYENEGL